MNIPTLPHLLFYTFILLSYPTTLGLARLPLILSFLIYIYSINSYQTYITKGNKKSQPRLVIILCVRGTRLMVVKCPSFWVIWRPLADHYIIIISIIHPTVSLALAFIQFTPVFTTHPPFLPTLFITTSHLISHLVYPLFYHFLSIFIQSILIKHISLRVIKRVSPGWCSSYVFAGRA